MDGNYESRSPETPKLDSISDEIKNLVREPGQDSSNSTTLKDGTTIMLFFKPGQDVVGVAEVRGGQTARKHRDRRWSISEPDDVQQQQRHVLRRDNRGKMEVTKFGFRDRDIRRIGNLVTKFKENKVIDG
jgi:hypothetical protein